MRSVVAREKWPLLLGILWLLAPLGAAFFLWLGSQRPGVTYSFFYTPGLTTALQLAALLLLWLGPGLLLLRLGRRK